MEDKIFNKKTFTYLFEKQNMFILEKNSGDGKFYKLTETLKELEGDIIVIDTSKTETNKIKEILIDLFKSKTKKFIIFDEFEKVTIEKRYEITGILFNELTDDKGNHIKYFGLFNDHTVIDFKCIFSINLDGIYSEYPFDSVITNRLIKF